MVRKEEKKRKRKEEYNIKTNKQNTQMKTKQYMSSLGCNMYAEYLLI